MRFRCYIALCVLLCAPPAFAANASFANAVNAQVGQVLNVQWPSNTISMPQLQNLFSQNPGASQLNIQFPNNTSWGVTPSFMQNIAGNYVQEAQKLGVNGGLSNLSFSSLSGMRLDANVLSIPIANLSGSAQDAIDNGLRELRYQQMHLSDSLPDWLKDAIVTFWGWLVEAWNWASPKLAALFQ